MNDNMFLNMALKYAGFGWYVFPLIPGAKAPLGSLVPHGFQDASNNSEVITEWWTRCPKANIGIATGASGLVVIDVDTKDDAPGWESWYSLVEKYGDSIGNTISVETPSGGCHNYYRCNGTKLFNTHNKLGDGIDTRANGGYVVAPPSVHPNGKIYQWAGGFAPDEIDVMTIPSSLEKLLVDAKDRTGSRQPIGGTILTGSRNETMASMAGSMRRRGFEQVAIEAALIAENVKCNPPLSNEEIHRISVSIAKYEPPREDEHNTDLGHARRLLRLHGQDMHYCDRLGGWFVWAGQRWILDLEGRVDQFTKDVSVELLAEADKIADDKKREAARKHALHTESAGAKKAMLEMAWSEPGIPVPPSAFDSDPWLFNCLNGTIDLRTGELKEHDREDLITKLAPVFYDPAAKSELWDKFLRTVTNDDQSLIRFLQLCAGYSLTGSTSEERLFFVYGVAATGKSTFMEALKNTMGDYAKTASFDAFITQNRNGAPRDDIAELAGSRMVASTEVDKGKKLADSLVKQLTGGDMVSARFLFKPLFEFRPTFKLWLVANDAPRATDTDTGLWRRVLRVPFEHEIPEDQRDASVKRDLTDVTKSGAAILAWAFAGCLEWLNTGLAIPTAVKKSTEQYRDENDPLKEFYADCCFFDPQAQVTRAAIWDAYIKWAKDNGEHAPITNKDLADRLRNKGCADARSSRGRYWKGIGLSEPVQDEDRF